MNIISPQIFLDIVVYIFISQWELKFEDLPYLCINWNYTEEAYQPFTILDSISLCYFKSLELLNFVQLVIYTFLILIFGVAISRYRWRSAENSAYRDNRIFYPTIY